MYPPKFDYYKATSLAEAVSLLRQHSGAKVLAGGHSLIPVMNLRLADPGTLIDIGRISELKGISASNGSIRIGALTPHALIAASADVPAVLAEAAGMIGDPQVRNRGTIGGNIAHADPASDLPTVLTALGAKIHVTGPNGNRTILADDFFTGLFATALADGEIVTAIEVAKSGAGSGSAYTKLFNPASRYAMVGAAAIVTVSGGSCTAAGVAVGGLVPSATRAKSVEAALIGKPLSEENIAAAAQAVLNDLGDDIIGDIHASAEYRKAMAPVFVKRALTAAAQRAG
ncbi:MAG: xanthine dehydrogenase family protein subunit M [Anaerolineae bacterium]|nr:xanthine dehydrogenase family protein subunit M [Anaerolineae bacterium]